MKEFLPATILLFVISLWTLTGVSESRSSLWTCSLSAYVVGDAAQQLRTKVDLDGRGLVTCRNVSGFDLDIPVTARLALQRVSPLVPPDQLRLTVTSGPFIVAGDINHLYDNFVRRTELRRASLSSELEITLIGQEDGVLMPAKIPLPPELAVGTSIESLALDFDSSAPALKPDSPSDGDPSMGSMKTSTRR